MPESISDQWPEAEGAKFEDMTDREVEEAYFAGVEHVREITASWWRKFGDKPEEKFDPWRHLVPQKTDNEWERRLLGYIDRAERQLREITDEFNRREISWQKLYELRDFEREEDDWQREYYERTGKYPTNIWGRKVVVLCRECGHQSTVRITNLAELQFDDWLDRSARQLRCTNCDVRGFVDAMSV